MWSKFRLPPTKVIRLLTAADFHRAKTHMLPRTFFSRNKTVLSSVGTAGELTALSMAKAKSFRSLTPEVVSGGTATHAWLLPSQRHSPGFNLKSAGTGIFTSPGALALT